MRKEREQSKPKLVCEHVLRMCYPQPSPTLGKLKPFAECPKCYTIFGEDGK